MAYADVPDVVKAIAELSSDTVIDGDIVALDEAGRPSFNLLLRLGKRDPLIVLYAFDLLMFQGQDVRLWPLEEQREQLCEIDFEWNRPGLAILQRSWYLQRDQGLTCSRTPIAPQHSRVTPVKPSFRLRPES